MQPRIYTYKITFEEVPYWYWGVHKEKKFGELYLGSPVTHRWMWEFYTPQIQILEFFANTDEGWKEARSVERRIVLQDLNNPLCLNENCGGTPSLESLRKGGAIARDLGLGIFSNQKNHQQIGGLITRERGIGIFAEECGGTPIYEKARKRGGESCKEKEEGIFKDHKKSSLKGAQTTNSQKYQCTVTGKILPPGPLACWQRAQGIDPSNRIRIK